MPLPKKEMGVVAELGALGFVCFAIFAPRIEQDKMIAAGKLTATRSAPATPAVSEAERITAAHAAAPWGAQPFANGAGTMGDALDELAGVTVSETDPDVFFRIDEAARAAGATPQTIVALRDELGIEGDLLDGRSELTFEDGTPLPRGIAGE